MIDLKSGKDLNLVSVNGKFDLDLIKSGPGKGNFRLTNNARHAVVTTMFSWKRGRRPGKNSPLEGGWYYDASGRRGTRLWTIILDRSSTRSELLSSVEDGGQQLVDSKWITKFSCDATKTNGRWRVRFDYQTPDASETTELVF